MFNFKYPYTDFHELNLDWILQKISELNFNIYRHKIHIGGYTRFVGIVYDIDIDIEYISDQESPYTDLKEITLNRIPALGTISNTTPSDVFIVYDIKNRNDDTYVGTIGYEGGTINYTEISISLDSPESYTITDTVERIKNIHT